ncbi:hypothetical protein OIO90_003666 [Microbotryomycetes sp. JL221]|nr:hypothetical protein OIO90_003666 [Microbotryomycetes sp. JL221]
MDEDRFSVAFAQCRRIWVDIELDIILIMNSARWVSIDAHADFNSILLLAEVRSSDLSSNKFKGFRQCIIYDSPGPDARLIGIEYVVEEDVFESLPQEEKRYWHSHKHEVEGGILQLGTKAIVPQAAENLAEKGPMSELHRTYGKTIHTWAYDKHPDLPLGPPSLMMSLQPDDKIAPSLQARYEEITGSKIEDKQQLRKGYIDLSYQVKPGADSRQGLEFEPTNCKVEQKMGSSGSQASLKSSEQSQPST